MVFVKVAETCSQNRLTLNCFDRPDCWSRRDLGVLCGRGYGTWS